MKKYIISYTTDLKNYNDIVVMHPNDTSAIIETQATATAQQWADWLLCIDESRPENCIAYGNAKETQWIL